MIATVTPRPYAGEADLEAIASLQNACEAVDQFGAYSTPTDLRTQFDDPRLDPSHDLQLWEVDGQLLGFAMIYRLIGTELVRGRLMIWVHPNVRGSLEADMVAWGDQRLRESLSGQSLPGILEMSIREEQQALRAQVEALGLSIQRYSYDMERSLTEPIDTPHVPEGFSIREMAGESEAEAWTEMYNQSFIDHPGFSPWKNAQVLHYLSEPIYRQDLNLVAEAADGTLAGFCWGMIYPDLNANTGRQLGEIDILGTRRGYRGLGLGRALLLATMHRLRTAGMEVAELNVIADNPTGALQLYESVGFRRKSSSIRYVRPLPM